MTQYRQADHCFMLTDGFGTFSTDIDDWFRVCIISLFFNLLTLIVKSYNKKTGYHFHFFFIHGNF